MIGPVPSVTVVITNYNYGRFLRQAVESALDQTRPAERVVVIDDGSTDDSPAIINSLPTQVEVIRQENQGVVAARNRALGLVDTTHVAFLDADDWLLPTFLRWHLVAWVVPHSRRLALTYSPCRKIDPAGNVVGHLVSGPWNPRRFALGNYVPNTAVYLRAALEDVGGYSEAFAGIGLEDWDLMLKLVDRHWHGRLVPRPTFVYRPLPTGRNMKSMQEIDAVRVAIRLAHPRIPPVRPLAGLHHRLASLLLRAFRHWDVRGL